MTISLIVYAISTVAIVLLAAKAEKYSIAVLGWLQFFAIYCYLSHC